MAILINRLAVIGVGLIGGSVSLALRKQGAVAEVVGCGRQAENLERAVELGVIDHYSHDIDEAVKDADVVLVCVPVGSMQAVFAELATAVSDQAVITDVGSTKSSVLDAARSELGLRITQFVPGHPIAGTEDQGAEAAFASLYEGRRCILTPNSETNPSAIAMVTQLWETCGSQVSCMDAEHHDEVLAATSHLPHVLAYSLVDQLASMQEKREIFEYAAGGFRDFTRIASSSPEMWRDIVHANREALLPVLEEFSSKVETLKTAIENDDMDTLLACFQRAKQTRDRLIGLAEAPALSDKNKP